MAENFPSQGVKKATSPQSECLHQLLRQNNKNKSTSKHTIAKILNSRDKGKILNATKREDRLPTKKKKNSHQTESRLLMGELTPVDGGKQLPSDKQKSCKTSAILKAVGLERISLSKKKTEPRRKEWECDIRNILSKSYQNVLVNLCKYLLLMIITTITINFVP